MRQMYRPLSRKSNLVIQTVNDELLVYDLNNNGAYCLNETCAFIWKLCDGRHSVLEISEKLSRHSGESITEEFVWLAIDQLRRDRLLESGLEQNRNHRKKLTRREVVKRIGLGTTIALPIISSIVAPAPLHAQSCLAPGTPINGLPPTTVTIGPTALNECQTYCNMAFSVCCSGTGFAGISGNFNTGECNCLAMTSCGSPTPV